MEGQATEQAAMAPATGESAVSHPPTVLGESLGMGGKNKDKRLFGHFLHNNVQYTVGENVYIDIGDEKHVGAIEKIYTKDESGPAVLIDIRWFFYPRDALVTIAGGEVSNKQHPAEAREIFNSESRERGQPAESVREKVNIHFLKPSDPTPELPDDGVSFICRQTYVATLGTVKGLPGRLLGIENDVIEEPDITDDEGVGRTAGGPRKAGGKVQSAEAIYAQAATTPGGEGDVTGKRQRRASRKKQEAGELSEEEDDPHDDDYMKQRKRRSAKGRKEDEAMTPGGAVYGTIQDAALPVDASGLQHGTPMEEVAASGGVGMVQHAPLATHEAAHAHVQAQHTHHVAHTHHVPQHMVAAQSMAMVPAGSPAPASAWQAAISSLPTLMAPGPMTLPGRQSDASDGKGPRKRSRRMKDDAEGGADDGRPAYNSFLEYMAGMDAEQLQELYWKYMEHYKSLYKQFQKAKDIVAQKRDDLERRKQSTANSGAAKQDPHPAARARLSQPPQRKSLPGQLGMDDGTGVQIGPDGQPMDPQPMDAQMHQVEHEVMDDRGDSDIDDGDGTGSRRRRRSAYELFDMHMKRFHRNHARALSLYEEAVMQFFGWVLSIKSEIQSRVNRNMWPHFDAGHVTSMARTAALNAESAQKETERLQNLRRKPGRKPKQNQGSSPAPLPMAGMGMRTSQSHMQDASYGQHMTQQHGMTQHFGTHMQTQMTGGFSHYTTQSSAGVPLVVVAPPQTTTPGYAQYGQYSVPAAQQEAAHAEAQPQATEYAAQQQATEYAAQQPQYAQGQEYAQQPAEYAQQQPAEYAQQPAAEYAAPAAEGVAAEGQPAEAAQASYSYPAQ